MRAFFPLFRLLPLLLLLLLAGCLGSSKRKSHYAWGVDYFDQGEFEDAARHFALAWDEKALPDALFNLGLTHLKRGAFSEAVTTYTSYLQKRNNDWQAHINLAFAHAGLKQHDLARTHFQKAIELNGTWPEPYCSYAQYLLQQESEQDNRKALALMEKTTAQASENTTAFYLHGLAASRLGQADVALHSLETAVARDANNQPALVLLGDMKRAKGDFTGARLHYISAAVLDPKDSNAFLGAAICHHEQGDLELALQALWQARALDPADTAVGHQLTLVSLAQTKRTIGDLQAQSGLADLDGKQKTKLREEIKTLLIRAAELAVKLEQP